MGTSFSSCNCSPLNKKNKYANVSTTGADAVAGRWDERHTVNLRLWAEVFHVSAASGAVRWQQVSEDLVPVNVTYDQSQVGPPRVFRITAYNSQVEKILDVKLVQPGTRLGQASSCFIYWKDHASGSTWGLNFTSPSDLRQFVELVAPMPRKAQSSYSLRYADPNRARQMQVAQAQAQAAAQLAAAQQHQAQQLHQQQQQQAQQQQQQLAGKRKQQQQTATTQSTPSSPSRRSAAGAVAATMAAQSQQQAAAAAAAAQEQLQCTCMASDALHRQRNGRVRYTAGMAASSTLPRAEALRAAAALRQDSSSSYMSQQAAYQQQTQQQQAAMQQYQQQQSMVAQQQRLAAMQQQQQYLQQQQQQIPVRPMSQQTRAQYVSSRTAGVAAGAAGGGGGMQTRSVDSQSMQYTQDRKRQLLDTSAQVHHHGHHMMGAQGMGGVGPVRGAKSTEDVATGTEDLIQIDAQAIKKMLQSSGGQSMPPRSQSQSAADRSKQMRSELGRRRSLERKACVDLSDQSPQNEDQNVLKEYEQHLRNALAKDSHEDTCSLQAFEALLSQSMESVVHLMREVQSELDAIRTSSAAAAVADRDRYSHAPHSTGTMPARLDSSSSRRPYWSRSYTLPSRGTSLPPTLAHLAQSSSSLAPGGGSGGSSSSRKHSAPHLLSGQHLDTLSLDGSTLPAFMRAQHSVESTDSRVYLTSSERELLPER